MTDQMIPADKVRDLHRDAASGASPEDVEAAREWADDVLEGRAALPEGWRLADHEVCGRVIVTTSIPNHDGRVYFVFPSAWDSLGYSGGYCTPDKLTYIDTTPTPATLTEGSEWGDIDALTTACETSGRDQIVVADCEGDVSVWSADAEWWELGTPSDGYEPYTIIHAGKKADQ